MKAAVIAVLAAIGAHSMFAASPIAADLVIPNAAVHSMDAADPVFVSRLDGHLALANSLALELAGVTRETRDPPAA